MFGKKANKVDTTSTEVSTLPPTYSNLQQPSGFSTASNYSQPNAFAQPLGVSSLGGGTVGYVAPVVSQSAAPGAPPVFGYVAQPAAATQKYEQIDSYTGHFFFALFVSILCPLTGPIALLLAAQAQRKAAMHDKAGGKKLGRISLGLSIGTICAIILLIVIVVPVTTACSGYKMASGKCYKNKVAVVDDFTCMRDYTVGFAWGNYENGYCYYD